MPLPVTMLPNLIPVLPVEEPEGAAAPPVNAIGLCEPDDIDGVKGNILFYLFEQEYPTSG